MMVCFFCFFALFKRHLLDWWTYLIWNNLSCNVYIIAYSLCAVIDSMRIKIERSKERKWIEMMESEKNKLKHFGITLMLVRAINKFMHSLYFFCLFSYSSYSSHSFNHSNELKRRIRRRARRKISLRRMKRRTDVKNAIFFLFLSFFVSFFFLCMFFFIRLNIVLVLDSFSFSYFFFFVVLSLRARISCSFRRCRLCASEKVNGG